MAPIDRSAVIFGNPLPSRDYAAACKNREKYVRKFGDDTAEPYPLVAVEAPVIGQRLGVQQLVSAGESDTGLVFAEKPVIIGTIRMGFGHYRIGMAMVTTKSRTPQRP